MQTLRSYGDTDFVTGMRAYAAFAVVLIHAGGAGLRQFGELGNRLADLGAAGVYVFFVISGFSVAASHATAANYTQYLRRRMLRIAPLYYVWLLLASIMVGETYWSREFGVPLDAYNWLMHLTFLSFLDYRVANSILGVEWSIAVEVCWYMVLPFLLQPILRHRHGTSVAISVSLLLYCATKLLPPLLPLPLSEAALAIHWSPLPYVFSYCLGISAFKLRRPLGDWGIACLLIGALVCALLSWRWLDQFVIVSVATFLLICGGSQASSLCRVLFTTKPVLFLGAISYGVYLSHFPLRDLLGLKDLGLTGFLLLSAAAIGASTITYYLVEEPFRRLAKAT
jgi:peptidoglycan/LPS O-acetylase OafA/YrhL